MNRIRATRRPLLWLALVSIFSSASPLVAQDGAAGVPPVSVDSDHWVYPLLDRMAADGLLDGVWMPGRRPVGGGAVAAALDSAAARAADRPAWRVTATAARAWFLGEYGVTAARSVRLLPRATVRGGDGPRTDPGSVGGGVGVLYRPMEEVGLWASPEVRFEDGGVEVPFPRLGAAWSPGPFRITGSYEPHRLGPGASGGIVLHDEAELGWLEVALDEPVRLPWLLRYLGPFQVSGAVSRIGADSLGPAVGFVTGDLRLQPFPWMTLGLYRSIVITDEVEGEKLGFRDLISSLLGTRSGTSENFDDQKASMSGSVKTEVLGLTVNPYFVWGWEDTWEINEDPGTILGLWLPAISLGGGPFGLRYEYTAFGEKGGIIWPFSDLWDWRNWYRHRGGGRRVYVDGDGELIGHPLGGYGSEHRVEVEAVSTAHRVLLRGALFTRERERGVTEDLSYDPPRTVTYSSILHDQMPGQSVGGSVRIAYTGDRSRVDVALMAEAGDGWRRALGSIRVTWLLP